MIKLNENTLLNAINKIENELKDESVSINEIAELLKECKEYVVSEIYLQSNMNNTPTKRIKAFQSMAKKFNKCKDKPSINGGYHINNNTYLCNSYYVIKSNNKIECVERDNQNEKYPDVVINGLDDALEKNSEFNVKIDTKDIVKEYKLFKASKQKIRTVDNHGVYAIMLGEYTTHVDITFLYDIIKIIDVDNGACLMSKYRIDPIVLKDDNFQAMLLPIRINY